MSHILVNVLVNAFVFYGTKSRPSTLTSCHAKKYVHIPRAITTLKPFYVQCDGGNNATLLISLRIERNVAVG